MTTNEKAGWDEVYSPVDNPMEVLSPKVDTVDFHQSDQGLSGDVAGLLGVTSIVTSDLEMDNKDAHSPIPLTSGASSSHMSLCSFCDTSVTVWCFCFIFWVTIVVESCKDLH